MARVVRLSGRLKVKQLASALARIRLLMEPPWSSTNRRVMARPEAGAALLANSRAVALGEQIEDAGGSARGQCRDRCR